MAGVTKYNSNNVSSGKAKLTCSLTEGRLSGVKDREVSSLDNWLNEPPSITDKIAFDLPGRRKLHHKSTSAGLGNLDNTGAPNWARNPEQQWTKASISINLKYY